VDNGAGGAMRAVRPEFFISDRPRIPFFDEVFFRSS
jgi:hypothetical protein